MILSDDQLFTRQKKYSFAPSDKMSNAVARLVVTGVRKIGNFESDRTASPTVQPKDQGLVKLKPVDKHLDASALDLIGNRDRVFDSFLNSLRLIGHGRRQDFTFPGIGNRCQRTAVDLFGSVHFSSGRKQSPVWDIVDKPDNSWARPIQTHAQHIKNVLARFQYDFTGTSHRRSLDQKCSLIG